MKVSAGSPHGELFEMPTLAKYILKQRKPWSFFIFTLEDTMAAQFLIFSRTHRVFPTKNRNYMRMLFKLGSRDKFRFLNVNNH